MKTTKLLLILFMLIMIGNMFAAFINLTVREVQTGPMVTLTRAKILLESPTYGTGAQPPLADRWVMQFYTSPNGVIDPLGTDGLPTGDDFVTAFYNGTSTQKIVFANASTWLTSTVRVYDDGVTGNTWQGDKVYLRIFNSNSIATATKYIQATALYTLPTGATTLNYIAQRPAVAPDYGWSDWTEINPPTETAPNPATLGLPNSLSLGYANPVTLSWTASVEDAGHSAPTSYDVYFGTTLPGVPNANVTVGTSWLAGAVLKNTTYLCRVIAKNGAGPSAPLNWSFTTRDEKIPGPATYLTPANHSSIEAHEFWPLAVDLTWVPGAGDAPTGYKVYFGTAANPTDMVSDQIGLSYQASIGVVGPYFWKVVPYITDPGTKKVTNGNAVTVRAIASNSKGDAVGNEIWTFEVTPYIPPVVPDIPAGGSGEVGGGPAAGGATVGTTVDLFNGPVIAPDNPALLVLHNLDNVTNPIILSYNGTGVGDLTMTVGPGTWWGMIFYGGAWHFADLPHILPLVVLSGTGQLVFLNVDFDAKDDIIIVLAEGDDPLPVELSSFTATLTSQYFVSLTWVTESETAVMGYNVYRSDNSEFSNSRLLTPVVIPATNTSSQQSYTMTDSELLETNHTYYYWLENVDMGGGTNLHGPISATVTGQPVTELPEISVMSGAYPNPFRMGSSTSIDVNIKAGEKGTVTVYNILGQAVKTFNVNQGHNKLTWNANGCASGIYFYKLSTPSKNTTKKLVIVN